MAFEAPLCARQPVSTTASQPWGERLCIYVLLLQLLVDSSASVSLVWFTPDPDELFWYAAVRPEDWELDVSCVTTEETSCGQTRITRRVTWVTSGRNLSLGLPTPRESSWRRCKLAPNLCELRNCSSAK